MRSQIRNPALAATLLLRNQHILQSLRISTDYNVEHTPHGRLSRPHSPVKIIKNLFESTLPKEPSRIKRPTASSVTADAPKLLPTPQSRPSSNDGPGKSSIALNTANGAIESLNRLEETMSTYILALHARKGNIVGRLLRARHASDELAINELYNSLLEDPSKHQLAAEVPVDVLFASFEKFVKVAWHDQMGPIISRQSYKAIQIKLDTMEEFEDAFRSAVSDMASQNQRAFRDVVKLLIDLLDGTGNDGDRGMLTISFAELLVPEGNPHDFVSILDRLVEDSDPLLSEQALSGQPTPYGSMNSESRNRLAHSGSVTSNTSSLRKKFGFGITRKNSKIHDSEQEGGSVWRSLSKAKHSHSESQPASLSKASLGRSNSTDTTPFGASPKRPVSRERPTVLGAFGFEQQASPFALSTIGENPLAGPPRKKRRSSVSDMRSLQASAGNTPTFAPPKGDVNDSFDASRLNSSPRTPSPMKQSMIPAPVPASPSTPTLAHATIRAASPVRREIPPPRTLPKPPTASKPSTSPQKADEVTITSAAPTHRRKNSSVSGIPKPGSGLSERPTGGNARKLPAPPPPHSPEKHSPAKPAPKPSAIPLPPPPQKPKMQSPTKLRERLASEQQAIHAADAALQAELLKIGAELARLSKGATAAPSSARPPPPEPKAEPKAEARLAALARRHADIVAALSARLDALAADIASSLLVSEARARGLDDLYREANAENEALYARFNEELARFAGKVKVGEAEAEVRRRWALAEEEAEMLRRENGRLKREVVGLRAQVRE